MRTPASCHPQQLTNAAVCQICATIGECAKALRTSMALHCPCSILVEPHRALCARPVLIFTTWTAAHCQTRVHTHRNNNNDKYCDHHNRDNNVSFQQTMFSVENCSFQHSATCLHIILAPFALPNVHISGYGMLIPQSNTSKLNLQFTIQSLPP